MIENIISFLDRCYLIRRYDKKWDYIIYYTSVSFTALVYLQAAPIMFGRQALLLCPSNSGLMTLFFGAVSFIPVVLMNIRYEFDILHVAHGTNSISRFILISLCAMFNPALFYTVLSEFTRCHG